MSEDVDSTIARTTAAHKDTITTYVAKLTNTSQEDATYEQQLTDLADAVTALQEYERQIPGLREAPHRRVSQQIVLWAAWAHAGMGALVGAAAFVGWTSRWWLAAVAVQLVVSLLCGGFRGLVSVGKHRVLRRTAGMLVAASVLLPLVAFGIVPLWLLVLQIVLWLGALSVVSATESSQESA